MAFDMLAAMGKRTATAAPSIVMIDIKDLIPNKKNFYRVNDDPDIEKENQRDKETIEMYGVLQPLIVTPTQRGKYKIIAGERRYAICKALTEEGKSQFKMLPCIIAPSLSEEDEQIQLIITNYHREKNLAEKMEEVRQLSELFQKKKERGEKIPGKLQNIIAECLNMSKSEVGRLQQIDKNLQPELKEAIKKNDLSVSTAVELSKLSAADQKAVYEKTGGKVTAKEVKEYQEEALAEPENMNIDGFEPMSAPKERPTMENNADDFYDEYGRIKETKSYRFQQYREFDKTITIKDDRLPEGGFKLYLVRDKEDGLWRSSAARGFVEVGAGRYPHRDADNPKDSKHFPAFETMEEALKYATGQMFWHCDEIQTEILKSQGYEEPQKELDFSEIQAAQYVMNLLERNFDKCSKLETIEMESGNEKAAKFERYKVEYLNKVLGRIKQDLFEMTGNDMFKE